MGIVLGVLELVSCERQVTRTPWGQFTDHGHGRRGQPCINTRPGPYGKHLREGTDLLARTAGLLSLLKNTPRQLEGTSFLGICLCPFDILNPFGTPR